MTFKEEMELKFHANQSQKVAEGVISATTEGDVAEIIVNRIKTIIRTRDQVAQQNSVHVQVELGKQSDLWIKIIISFFPNSKRYEESIHIQTKLEEYLASINKTDLYYIVDIVDMLADIFQKEGFTDLMNYKYDGTIDAFLNLT